jgi:hypothetical protein
MNFKKLYFFIYILSLCVLLGKNVFAEDFKNPMIKIQQTTRIKTLTGINFPERKEIEVKIDNQLRLLGSLPLTASLLVMASAELGDSHRYDKTLRALMEGLWQLEDSGISKYWNSYKAFMWGRILISADNMNDVRGTIEAQRELDKFLRASVTPADTIAMTTWAWGYRAAFNENEYQTSKKIMLENASILSKQYKASGDPNILADALWAWVMNIQAAAFVHDQQTYHWIKEQIKLVTNETSIVEALDKHLLNAVDYPAWAIAKVRYAASVIGDQVLYDEIENVLLLSIQNARKSNEAEYVLAVVDNQLAMLNFREKSF